MNRYLAKIACVAVCVFTPGLPAVAAETPGVSSAELVQMDTRLQEFSVRFYLKLSRVDKQPKVKSIDALKKAIDLHLANAQPMRAVALIADNIEVVEKNIDTNATTSIIALLLQVNEWKTASRLYNKLKDLGDKSLVSNASLSFAKYYLARDQWENIVEVTQPIASDIALEDFHHARLMHGIALQRMRKHRAALAQYKSIPKTSRYYASARLNTAIANIRQDWWTDAHVMLGELIAANGEKGEKGDDAATDRLYTVLGYSLLRQQYYRHARDAFRNVSLEGPHTNKALLGIALSAAYQDDYVGALNAIRVLKNKNTYDLPVDETHLLMPFVYEKLEQRTTAMAGYAQAVKYYEDRVASIEKATPTNATQLREQFLTGGPNAVAVNQEVLNLEDKLPQAFFDNFRVLAAYQPQVDRLGDAALSREYSALNSDYANGLQKAVQGALAEKTVFLNHYMSQARFGLATVNDNGSIP